MEKNYKILQIVDSLDIGGTERMSANIYNALTSSNIQNYLVVSRNIGPIYNFINEKDNVVFLNKKGVLDCFAFFKLFKLISKYRPSIIHAHQTSIYWAFILKSLIPGITVIWHDHWGFSDLLKDSDRKIIKFFSFLMDGVICVNDKIKDWNIQNLKINKKYIAYIPNFPLIQVDQKSHNEIPVILCLANIRDQKDHLNLIAACALLKDENIKFKLHLAGSLEDKEWVEKVKKKVTLLNLNNDVVFLGPVINISELLSKADVGVLSSVSEGLPVSLLEYGLAGLPVVCTDVGQCKEVLGNGEFGWVVPSKSPQELAIAIKEALSDKIVANKKAEGLNHNIIKNYGSTMFMEKYFSLLNKINNSDVQ
ncbi:glycosyltransferase involved in cell wall biosynthesis [Flavobacterium sp. CG_23.5]|uniref:glycosyltransferase n=1 Tax=Flavobacterium sp. CG_23.5 TaxID=2760708 RepID=UPI001AE0ED70|nr:glycosyltransferase [Flavobacterium sp. CG_23.5]MBP2283023.1 glycosyltransferase involved in cell wall biosynthesis [Flavobacterium sp. CG_23.5]